MRKVTYEIYRDDGPTALSYDKLDDATTELIRVLQDVAFASSAFHIVQVTVTTVIKKMA